METQTRRMDPSTRFVRSLNGEYFMLREVAKILDISPQALRKFVHDPNVSAPSYWVMFGKLKIYLYTREDIEEMRNYLAARTEVFRVGEKQQPKVGRPRKYTPDQRRDRQREYAKAYYWKRRLEKAREDGDEVAIDRAQSKLYELEKALAELDQEIAEANSKSEPVVHRVVETHTETLEPASFNPAVFDVTFQPGESDVTTSR